MESLTTSVPPSEGLVHFNTNLASIRAGQNLLVVVDGVYSLLKYERHDDEKEDFYNHRISRSSSISTVLSELLPCTKEERAERDKRRRKERTKLKGNIYSTHRLDFTLDEEFGIYLPSSSGRDMFLVLATRAEDGEITLRDTNCTIFADDSLIEAELRKILLPNYFASVITPFLESKPTRFAMPGYKRSWFFKPRPDFWGIKKRFAQECSKLPHGSFVYVGCKEEVYLLALAKAGGDQPYTQGTYTTSAKPLFYFSNNYLDFISKHDAEKPKAPERMRGVNVAEYRTYDIPGFHGQPFVFPQMGRSQNCKNTIFTGRPDIITSDPAAALAHFRTTDFAEFEDVVRAYAERINEIHPSSGKPNGKYYY